jgi:hypothetical protein
MARGKKYSAEQIIAKLREAEVHSVPSADRTFPSWQDGRRRVGPVKFVVGSEATHDTPSLVISGLGRTSRCIKSQLSCKLLPVGAFFAPFQVK